MTRADRRREERQAAKRRDTFLIAGDGIVAATLGQRYEGVPHADLPPKRPGEHRWVATAAYVIKVETVEAASDPDTLKFLDSENLMSLAIGCWDCEQPLGVIQPGTPCPGDSDG